MHSRVSRPLISITLCLIALCGLLASESPFLRNSRQNRSPASGASDVSSGALSESIEVLLSGTASNILAAHSAYAPHFAQLTIRGRFQDLPTVEFYATASINTAAGGGGWQVSSISVSGTLPPGYAAPVIGAEVVADGFGGLTTSYVWIRGGSSDWRASTWTIEGEASDQVGVVLLPRYRMLPWRGAKQVDILKIRHTDPAPPANQTPPSVYQSLFSQLQTSYANMSNGRLSLNLNLVDHLTFIPPSLVTADCGTFFSSLGGNDYTFRKRVILEKLAADPGWRRDAVFYTYDHSLSHGLTCSYFRTAHGGGQPPTPDCPECGPGGEIKVGSVFPGEWGQTMTSGFGHELGHALGFNERYFNPINYCTDGDPQAVKPGHLFYRGTTCRQDYGGLQDDSMGGAGVRDGVRYDLVERASLGWLKPANVKTVVGSGIYDLYQENDDLTVPESLPVILQIPVQYEGIQSFVYLTTVNQNVFNRYVGYPDPAVSEHQSSGVILSAGSGVIRGQSRAASGLSYYSYKNNQPGQGMYKSAIPAGASVRLIEMGEPLQISVLSKSGGHVRVQVTYGAQSPSTVTVGGRVLTPAGAGLRNAVVKLMVAGAETRTATTSTFGYYSFENVPTGVSALLGVSSKRYRFAPIERTFMGNVDDLNFVGLE